MLNVLEIKPERSDADGVDMSRGGTGNMVVEGCRGWTYGIKEEDGVKEEDAEERE